MSAASADEVESLQRALSKEFTIGDQKFPRIYLGEIERLRAAGFWKGKKCASCRTFGNFGISNFSMYFGDVYSFFRLPLLPQVLALSRRQMHLLFLRHHRRSIMLAQSLSLSTAFINRLRLI